MKNLFQSVSDTLVLVLIGCRCRSVIACVLILCKRPYNILVMRRSSLVRPQVSLTEVKNNDHNICGAKAKESVSTFVAELRSLSEYCTIWETPWK